jgi:hypothetical protein
MKVETVSFLDCKKEHLGSKYFVMGTRVCMHKSGVFLPSVLVIVLVVRQTTASSQVGVCAPFSLAHTGLLVLVFR